MSWLKRFCTFIKEDIKGTPSNKPWWRRAGEFILMSIAQAVLVPIPIFGAISIRNEIWEMNGAVGTKPRILEGSTLWLAFLLTLILVGILHFVQMRYLAWKKEREGKQA